MFKISLSRWLLIESFYTEGKEMQKEIRRFFQELWNQLKKTLADQCGDFPLGNVKTECNNAIERDIIVNNTKIHIKSIFTGKTSLYIAMKNIVARKISDSKLNQ